MLFDADNTLMDFDEAEKQGVSVAHYDMRFLKPIDTDILREVGEKFKYVVTLEDGCVNGGLGSAVVEYMAENGDTPAIKVMGIPDSFVEHGTPEQLYKICGMDADSVLAAIMEFNKKLQELRNKKGLTQEELGNIVGLQKSAIAKYENGRVVFMPENEDFDPIYPENPWVLGKVIGCIRKY